MTRFSTIIIMLILLITLIVTIYFYNRNPTEKSAVSSLRNTSTKASVSEDSCQQSLYLIVQQSSLSNTKSGNLIGDYYYTSTPTPRLISLVDGKSRNVSDLINETGDNKNWKTNERTEIYDYNNGQKGEFLFAIKNGCVGDKKWCQNLKFTVSDQSKDSIDKFGKLEGEYIYTDEYQGYLQYFINIADLDLVKFETIIPISQSSVFPVTEPVKINDENGNYSHTISNPCAYSGDCTVDGQVCSGHGTCKEGKCDCERNYFGNYCQYSQDMVFNDYPSFINGSFVINTFNTSSNVLSFCLNIENIKKTNSFKNVDSYATLTEIYNDPYKQGGVGNDYPWTTSNTVKTLKLSSGQNAFQKWFICKTNFGEVGDQTKQSLISEGNIDPIKYGDYVVLVGKGCNSALNYLSAGRGEFQNHVITSTDIAYASPFKILKAGNLDLKGDIVRNTDDIVFELGNTVLQGCSNLFALNLKYTDSGGYYFKQTRGNFDVRNESKEIAKNINYSKFKWNIRREYQ